MPDLKIEMVPPSRLAPYARNARTHSAEQIAQIAASIVEFGFTNPILADREFGIIAGHGRLMAAQRLELPAVPVIMLEHLSDAQRRALIIADNKIAENAGWDEELLKQELAALRLEAFDLDLLGFSGSELDDLLAEIDLDETPPPALGDPDFVPEPPKANPVSRRGDVWIMGQHRLMVGDSTSRGEVEALCLGSPVDAVWTDPPYNVNYEGTAGKIQNDNMESGEFRRFLCEAFSAAFAVMRPGAPIYVAHADTEGLNFRAAFRDAGLKLSGCLVWVKPSLVLGRSDYQWRHEPILYGWKPGAAHSWFGGRNKTTVFDGARERVRVMPDGTVQIDIAGQLVVVRGDNMSVEAYESSVIRHEKPSRNAEHPTMKPVGLILEMLENSTKRGDKVLDLFGGSGSTLIACHKAGRIARLMELDEKFADVIVDRWQAYTGLEAKRERDGVTFAQAKEAKQAA